jgi:uncharacterized membrane protein
VWISELQTQPLDQNSRHFYLNRESKIQERIAKIGEDKKKLIEFILFNFESNFRIQNAEVDWACFTDFAQVERFINCCPIEVLLKVFQKFYEDNKNFRSGFPGS